LLLFVENDPSQSWSEEELQEEFDLVTDDFLGDYLEIVFITDNAQLTHSLESSLPFFNVVFKMNIKGGLREEYYDLLSLSKKQKAYSVLLLDKSFKDNRLNKFAKENDCIIPKAYQNNHFTISELVKSLNTNTLTPKVNLPAYKNLLPIIMKVLHETEITLGTLKELFYLSSFSNQTFAKCDVKNIAEMHSIETLNSRLDMMILQTKNMPLYVSYLSNLSTVLNRVLSYSSLKKTFSETHVSQAYRALSVLVFHLSKLYSLYGSANTSFYLLMRSMELYVTGFLLSAGEIEIRKYFVPLSKKHEYKFNIKGTSDKVNGFGPLWYIIKKKKFITEKNKINQIYRLIDVRNSHILGHGIEFNDIAHVASSTRIVKEVIEDLDSKIIRSKCKWTTLDSEFGRILSFDFGKNFTSSFDQFLGVVTSK